MKMLFCFCDQMQNCRGEKGICPGVLRGPKLGPPPWAGRRESKATAWTYCGHQVWAGCLEEALRAETFQRSKSTPGMALEADGKSRLTAQHGPRTLPGQQTQLGSRLPPVLWEVPLPPREPRKGRRQVAGLWAGHPCGTKTRVTRRGKVKPRTGQGCLWTWALKLTGPVLRPLLSFCTASPPSI